MADVLLAMRRQCCMSGAWPACLAAHSACGRRSALLAVAEVCDTFACRQGPHKEPSRATGPKIRTMSLPSLPLTRRRPEQIGKRLHSKFAAQL